MNTSDQTVFDKVLHPYLQAAICGGLALTFMLLAKLTAAMGVEVTSRFPWITAGSFILLFALFNSLILLRDKDLKTYWQRSIISFIVLMPSVGLLAFLFSGQSIQEAGSFKWIFFILTFGYLSFMAIVVFLKQMFSIVAREEERMHGNKID